MSLEYKTRSREHGYTISPPDPDGGQWSDRGSYGLSVEVTHIYRPDSDASGMDIDAWKVSDIYGVDDIPAGEIAYLVVVRYTTGDTFGSDQTWTIAAVKADYDEAEEAERKCHEPRDENAHYLGYRPWDGYFEHLESVSITTLRMEA